MGRRSWDGMYKTLPGALSQVIDTILYNFCDEHGDKFRGVVLKLSNAERMYVSLPDGKWPEWEGRDGAYVDVRKTLRQIQYLLEAYAFAETHHDNNHVCKHCESAAP